MKRKAVLSAAALVSLFCLSLILMVGKNDRNLKTASGPDAPELRPADQLNLQKQKIAENYGRFPINFEPNLGQTAEKVKFLANGTGYAMFLTGNEAVISLKTKNDAETRSATVTMHLQNADKSSKTYGVDEAQSKTNYFIGNDPERWQTDVPNFEKVRYEQIYDGVDLIYYGNQRQLEYDFVVAPNADPDQIKLKISGVEDAKIDKKTGDLLLTTGVGEIRQHKPFSYQTVDGSGERREIASLYELKAQKNNEFIVSFKLAEYDRSKELVIDPILVYGSYLGGSLFDQGSGIAVDAAGNAYITGTAASRDFPTTAGSVKPVLLPRSTSTTTFWNDAFVTKINPDGTSIVFSTYFGGRDGNEAGGDIEVDNAGNIYFSGTTLASDFPTVNAYQATFGGTDDTFLAKLNPTGSAIIYSTYLGGNNTDLARKIALDPATGEATAIGTASSPDFPTTPGVLKEKLCNSPTTCSGIFYSGSFVARFSANGSIVFATLFNASLKDVALDFNNNAVIAGTGSAALTTPGAYQTTSTGGVEGYLGILNPTGSQIVFGTLLGGGLESDLISGVALDAAGNMYVTGTTENAGFPTTPGAFDTTFNGTSGNNHDGFLTKFNPAGNALVYSTFLGGIGKDEPKAIALGSDDSAFVLGETTDISSFPLRNSLVYTGQIFLTHFNQDASALVYSTVLGQGSGIGLAVDGGDNAFITGRTNNVPVTPGAFQTVRGGGLATSPDDGFVLKIGPADETATYYAISGSVSDANQGFNNNYSPIVATLTGTVNRVVNLPYNGGLYYFGNLPAGGNYTVSVRKTGFEITPESVVFNNLGANQFANFTILRNREPEATITSPQHGAIYIAPASITIRADATDPDAGDTIQKVDFVAYNSSVGSVPIGTDTEAPFEITWNDVQVGTWSLYAVPYDNHGLRGNTINTVHVFIHEPNGPSVSLTSPVDGDTYEAGIYFPFAVNVSQTVTRVEYFANGTLIGRSLSSPFSMQLRIIEPGNYAITAKAFNSQEQSNTSNVANITVAPFNHTISGKILNSINATPIAGVTVNLTSSNNPSISGMTTTDAEGNYSFTNIFGPWDTSVTLTATHQGYNFNPASQTFLLGFSNHPNRGFQAIPVTGITVALTSPFNSQQFPPNPTVPVAANASSTAGTITKVEFYNYDRGQRILLATDMEAPYSFDWQSVPGGYYTVFALAYDSDGGIAQSASVNFNVAQVPATVRLQGDIRSANGGYMQGITVRLIGMANGNPINQTAVSNTFGAYGFFNLPSSGDYTITPEAPNQTFTPPSFSVTNPTRDYYDIDFQSSVNNQSPTIQIESPTDGQVFTMPVTIQMTATANDIDGQIVHLKMTAVGAGRSYTIGEVNSGNFSVPWTPAEPDGYTIYATATDNGGFRTTVQIGIIVNQPAPVEISGRVVDRNSQGIPGVLMTLNNTLNSNVPDITAVTDLSGNYTLSGITTFNYYRLQASKLNYTFAPQSRYYPNISSSQTNGDFTGTLQLQPSDFDGDGMSDIAVWRPSSGVWHIQRSNDSSYYALQFGGAAFGDVAVPGNYDGDKKTDYAVYRNGVWYVLQSSNGQVRTAQFGLADDKPVQGDYDGDGKTDFAVWRPSDGVWYIWRSSDGGFDFRQFGLNGDIPLVGDYDGDGKTDLTVFRPSTGIWYIQNSLDASFRAFQWGLNGDIPLVGDFDGDKLADFAVFRPADGVWHIWNSATETYKAFHLGISTDIPVPGDFDLDGKTDFGVFRPSEGNWYVFKSSTNSYVIQHFGVNEDMPIPAAYR